MTDSTQGEKNNPAPAEALLDEIRRLSFCDHTTIDAATRLLGDREIVFLASRLTTVAAHIATRAGIGRGLPPPGTLPGAGTDRLDLSAQASALPVAELFVRNTLFRWRWGDVLLDAQCVVHDLGAAFIATVEGHRLGHPTRMTLRLRAISAARLVVELHDSAENTGLIAATERLISERVDRISVRCGHHHTTGRTVLWAELARPELGRWQ